MAQKVTAWLARDPSTGRWAISGWDGATDGEMRDDAASTCGEDTCHLHRISFDLPAEIVVVVGEIEKGES